MPVILALLGIAGGPVGFTRLTVTASDQCVRGDPVTNSSPVSQSNYPYLDAVKIDVAHDTPLSGGMKQEDILAHGRGLLAARHVPTPQAEKTP